MTQPPVLAQAADLFRQERFVAVIHLLSAAPAAVRDSQGAQRLLAAAHAQSGQWPQARAAITQALQQQALELPTRAMAARVFSDLGEWSQAFVQLDYLVQAAPQQASFWRMLWQAAKTPPQVERALALSRVRPLDFGADLALAQAACTALLSQGHVDEGLRCADAAWRQHRASSDPQTVAAAQKLFVSAWVEARPLAALDHLRAEGLDDPARDLLAVPDSVEAHLLLPAFYRDAGARAAWRARYACALRALRQRLQARPADKPLIERTAFRLAYHGEDDRELQSLRGELLAELMRPHTPRQTQSARVGDGRRRVAFVSRHVRDCTVGHYFKHFLTDSNDARTAVSVFCFGACDAFSDAVAARVDAFHHWPQGDFATLAKAIADDAPDVLVYLEVGMDPTVEKLAAMRLAPVQAALWGHPDTTGLPTLDTFISAAALEPEGAERHYRERLQLLPGLGTHYPKPPAASGKSAAELGLPAQGLRLMCAQTLIKWTPEFVQALSRILLAAPQARLLAFDSGDALEQKVFTDYLREQWRSWQTRGLTPEARLHWLSGRSRADFLATLAQCDLSLDSFGFSGGNTTLDALSVGLPVLTLQGAFMRGRQSAAMLRRIGRDDLIASDAADYEDKALRLLADESRRACLRAEILAHCDELFADPAPVQAFNEWLHSVPLAP